MVTVCVCVVWCSCTHECVLWVCINVYVSAPCVCRVLLSVTVSPLLCAVLRPCFSVHDAHVYIFVVLFCCDMCTCVCCEL